MASQLRKQSVERLFCDLKTKSFLNLSTLFKNNIARFT